MLFSELAQAEREQLYDEIMSRLDRVIEAADPSGNHSAEWVLSHLPVVHNQEHEV